MLSDFINNLKKAVIKKDREKRRRKEGRKRQKGRILKAEGEMDMGKRNKVPTVIAVVKWTLGYFYITWHFLYYGPQNSFLVGICTSWLVFL